MKGSLRVYNNIGQSPIIERGIPGKRVCNSMEARGSMTFSGNDENAGVTTARRLRGGEAVKKFKS